MKRYLIVTGDDYGFSAERNKGIEEAFRNGAVQSASLLMNCTGTQAGAKMDDICLGLHLNLTEGLPVGSNNYKTLTDDKGEFHAISKGNPIRWNNNNIQADEIQAEIQSQIQAFENKVGHKPAYVDGHQHIHVHPSVAETFASVLKENGIFATRYPVEVNIATKSWVIPEIKTFFEAMIGNAEAVRPVLDKYGIKYSDCFTGLSTMGESMTPERLRSNILEAFQSAETGCQDKGSVSCELMTHPGYPTSRDFGGFNWGTDDFGASDERLHELRLLSSPEMSTFYKENNITLVSHKMLVQ